MPTSGGTPGTTDSTSHLSRFVREWLKDNDMTERGLAKRARDPDTGMHLQHGWINSLVGGTISRAPELWRLRALAAAMGVSARRLAELAAAQWLGVDVAELHNGQASEDAEVIVVSVPPDLTDEERKLFLRMAEGIAKQIRS